MAIYEKSETITKKNADGTVESIEEKTSTTIKKNEEPDYIKIYTKMWCEFNGIPRKYHDLLFSLAIRMSYCDKNDLENSQTVYVVGRNRKAICKECGWNTDDPLTKGLKVLCEKGAIRKLERGLYQINPQYAGKGPWRYNPKLENGGIEDLITVFKFKDKNVETQVISNNDDCDGDEDYVLTTTKITPKPDEENERLY